LRSSSRRGWSATSACPASSSSSCAASSRSSVETLQPQYSLVERAVEGEILSYAERERIGVIVYSPMGSGLLTGRMTRERIDSLADDDWRKRDPRFLEPQLSGHLALVQRLTAVAL
jgi:aryl-alcohol dehydrogenase-like predicted oxidoreductase